MTIETDTSQISVCTGLFSRTNTNNLIDIGVKELSNPNNYFEYLDENKPTRPFIDLDTEKFIDYDDEIHFKEIDDVILSILQSHEHFQGYSLLHSSHYEAEDWRYDFKKRHQYHHQTNPKLSYRLTDPTLICKDMKDLKIYVEEKLKPNIEEALGEFSKYVKVDTSVYRTGKFSCVNSWKFPQQQERIKRLVKGTIQDTFIQGLSGKEELLDLHFETETDDDDDEIETETEEEEKQPEPEPEPKPKPNKVIVKPKEVKTKPYYHPKDKMKTENYSLQDKHVALLMSYMKNPDTITMKDYINVGLVLKNNDYPMKLFYDWGQLNETWKTDNAIDAPVRWEGFHNKHYPMEVIYKICKTHEPEKWKDWKLKYLSTNNTIPIDELKKGENAVLKHILPELRTKVKYTQKRFYILDESNLWIRSENCSYLIITLVHKYIDNSITKIQLELEQDISEDRKKTLREERNEYISHYNKTNKSSFVSHIEKQLKTILHDKTFYDKLDSNDGIIAFKNGVWDLELGELRDIFSSDYLSQTLEYNYIPSNEEDKETIKQDLLKICNNNKQHLEYYLSIIGQSFTGLASKEKALYFMIGEGGNNGKTTFFEALCDIMPLYAHKTDSELIEKCGRDKHKYIADMKGKRFVYCDELLKSRKLCEKILKLLGEGSSIPYKVMYGETSRLLTKFKFFMIMNHQPVFSTDGGLQNRTRVLKFDSAFSKKHEEDDYDNLNFCVDPEINDRWRGQQKYAIIDLIFEYARMYYEDGYKLKPYPDDLQEHTDNLLLENDDFRSWFDTHFEIDPEGKTSKESIMCLTEDGKNPTSDMKRLGYKYDSQLYIGLEKVSDFEKSNGKKPRKIKGGYKGFRLREEDGVIDKDNEEDAEYSSFP